MSAISDYAWQIFAVSDAEVRKLRHDAVELVTRAVQPALWLLLFGQVMAHVKGITLQSTSYLNYLVPGILGQSVLFVAIFYGINTIWKRDLGVLHRYLVSPAPRSALVLGKALSSTVRGFSQALVVYALTLILGVQVSLQLGDILGVIVFIALAAGLFSTFSVIVACIVRTRERFLGIGQVLTMPIFFASNAIYPIRLMPHWLQIVSRLNPLTYEVDALRGLMLPTTASRIGIPTDFVVLVTSFVVLVTIAAWLYPRMGE
ncbi:MAG TPA: ABC transporter permease [Candidatus Binataceae bacterium]|nr:ABC transporter permease [Candidatus Binataceae bacterium]